MDKLLILEETDTEAGIAYLSEGPGAPAIILIVSWSTAKDANRGMHRIMLCGAWQIVAEGHTLMIIGRGSTVFISGEEADAVFWSTWEMDDPHAVSLFEQVARRHGYFLLLPTVNKIPGPGAPVPCYLI